VWYGKGAERLGLPSELTKEDFVAIANNRIPQSGERLTARTNDTRTHIVWELDEETQSRIPKEKEVNNRRVCVDFNAGAAAEHSRKFSVQQFWVKNGLLVTALS
jgi:TrwC relaxase